MTLGLILFLAIPYFILGNALYMSTLYVGGFGIWKQVILYLLCMIFYVPALLVIGIIFIITYLYYGIKRIKG